MIFKKCLILLGIFNASISIQAQNYIEDISKLVNKTHAERTLMLTPFYEDGIRYLDSTNVFSKIQKIETIAKKNNDGELLLETELMRVHYYCYKNYFKKESVVQKIKALDKIAKDKNVLWLEIRTQSLLANYLFNSHQDYGLGFEYFERTVQLLENVTSNEFPLKQICLYQLANVYHEFKEYNNAVVILKKAKDTKSKLKSYYYEMNIYNTLGDSYRELQKIDSSTYYFNLTLQKALHAKDRIWEGISSGNLGYNYFLEGNIEVAIPLLSLDVKIAKENNDWGLASNALIYLAEIELIKKNIPKAIQLVNDASYYAHKSNEYKRLADVFPLQSKIASYQSKPNLASKYLDSTFIVKDSLDKLFDTRKLIRAKQRIQIEQQKLKEKVEQQKQSKRLLLRNGIIFLLVALVLIIILFYNRYRLKSKSREQIIGSQKELAFQKLEYATVSLDNFRKSISNKNKLIIKFKNDLEHANEKVKDLVENPNQILYQTSQNEIIEQLQKAAILTDKDWREFVTLFEVVHSNFFNRLKEVYPNLTPSEIKLMALCRLQLGNKEMALILGVGTSAIRQIKSRLRKKINLSQRETLQSLSSLI